MARRYPALLVIILPSFVYGFFRFSTGFLLPRLEETYSIKDAEAGGVVSLSVGLVTIGVFLSGYSSRRYGDRNTIILGFLVFAASMGVITASGNLYEFVALFLLASFGGGLMIPASYSVVGRMLPQRKGVAVGFVTSAYNLGGLVGPSAITLVLIIYGWSFAFVTFSIVGFAGLVLFWFILGRKDEGCGPSAGVSMRSLLKNRMIRVLVLGRFCRRPRVHRLCVMDPGVRDKPVQPVWELLGAREHVLRHWCRHRRGRSAHRRNAFR